MERKPTKYLCTAHFMYRKLHSSFLLCRIGQRPFSNPAGIRANRGRDRNELSRTLPARPQPVPYPRSRANPRPNDPFVRAADVNSPIQPNFLPNRNEPVQPIPERPGRRGPVKPLPQHPDENEPPVGEFPPNREPVKPLPHRRGDQGAEEDHLNFF